MEGKTHMLTALAAYSVINTMAMNPGLTITGYLRNTPDITLISLGAILTGALMPDLDMPGSTAGSKVSVINMKMVKIIVNIALLFLGVSIVVFSGNIYTLYGGLAVLLFSILSYKFITNKLLYILRRIVQIVIIAVLLTLYFIRHEEPLAFCAVVLACYFFSKHRGLSHTLTLSMISSFCVYTAFNYYGFERYSYYAAAYFFAGCFLHIYVNDFITDRGVPNLLYPLTGICTLPVYFKKWGFSTKAFKESFKISRIKFLFTMDTGATGEVIFSMMCIAVIIFGFIRHY